MAVNEVGRCMYTVRVTGTRYSCEGDSDQNTIRDGVEVGRVLFQKGPMTWQNQTTKEQQLQELEE